MITSAEYVIDQTFLDMADIVGHCQEMRSRLVEAMEASAGDDSNLADSVCEIMDDYLPSIALIAMHANKEHQDMIWHYKEEKNLEC